MSMQLSIYHDGTISSSVPVLACRRAWCRPGSSRTRNFPKSRGFGFVEMPNKEEAEKAISGLNGKAAAGTDLSA
jgi:RNA recognition motif-containing protein